MTAAPEVESFSTAETMQRFVLPCEGQECRVIEALAPQDDGVALLRQWKCLPCSHCRQAATYAMALRGRRFGKRERTILLNIGCEDSYKATYLATLSGDDSPWRPSSDVEDSRGNRSAQVATHAAATRLVKAGLIQRRRGGRFTRGATLVRRTYLGDLLVAHLEDALVAGRRLRWNGLAEHLATEVNLPLPGLLRQFAAECKNAAGCCGWLLPVERMMASKGRPPKHGKHRDLQAEGARLSRLAEMAGREAALAEASAGAAQGPAAVAGGETL